MTRAELPRMVLYDLPLRPNLVVRIALPVDLNTRDAARLCTIIQTLALTDEQFAAAELERLAEEIATEQPVEAMVEASSASASEQLERS